jgi:CheY-like chemotaxis protein
MAMDPIIDQFSHRANRRFEIFHELMRRKVREILFVSSPYDAWVMEKDRGLSEAIVLEYRGLNLSHPPRLNWVASVDEASAVLEEKTFDLVIIMTQASDLHYPEVHKQIKRLSPDTPIVRFYHRAPGQMVSCEEKDTHFTPDRTFMWSGDTKLLLAAIKSIEDQLNAKQDTDLAAIRVIIFVEDSPEYLSSLLPVFYQELVSQTQAVMEEGLNQEHRMLAMRARPKILLANCYETALELFTSFEPCVLGVISDVRFPREGTLDGEAGVHLLKKIHKKRFDIPLLLVSSEQQNEAKAKTIPAAFVDKNSPALHEEVHAFFLEKLGFGPFGFLNEDGKAVARATNLLSLENGMRHLPDHIFYDHWIRNDFSRWLFTRAETMLATELRSVTADDFDNDLTRMRQYLYERIRNHRMQRQKGVLVDFESGDFDVDADFMKIGDGSLGGKARGLAFFSSWLYQRNGLKEKFEEVDICIPQTLIITTECFEDFLHDNNLDAITKENLDNEAIAEHFLRAEFPDRTRKQLKIFLQRVRGPLAVRSSSLLEDAKFRAYAGLYRTYMLPNNNENLDYRLADLLNAIKKVYASTYYREPKSFSHRIGNRTEEEKMAVVIQQIVGEQYGDFFYPALSGVAQSYNYYPFSIVRPEDGVAIIALGLGKTVTEGGKCLRFSPSHPEVLPQLSTVDDALKNSQRYFFALRMDTKGSPLENSSIDDSANLVKREISEAVAEYPVSALASFYDPQEHRIREAFNRHGAPVMTFASVLKYRSLPLAEVLQEILLAGQEGMGGPVEIEFSLTLASENTKKPQLAIVQIRPMGAHEELMTVDIDLQDTSIYSCVSHQALGNTINNSIRHVIYVKPDAFDPAKTVQMAQDVARLNAVLKKAGHKYLLIGPGRWGSADRWLGIPVSWSDICEVAAIIETFHPRINAEPSQGSHFFHNITSLGINYLTIENNQRDFLDWRWVKDLKIISETDYIIHSCSDKPITLKVDGRQSLGVINH